MKKLFFFRSNGSNSNNNKQTSPPLADKQVSWEKSKGKVEKPAKNKHDSEDQVHDGPPVLRRSFSFSSGSFNDSADYYSNKKPGDRISSSRPQTPERQARSECVDAAKVRRVEKKFDCNVSRELSDLSETSYSSSNVSSILDRYVDGEQQMEERCESKANSSMKNQFSNGYTVVKRPPRIQLPPAHVLRDVSRKQKPKSQSFRETRVLQLPFSSKDGGDRGYCNESPRKLAKHVVERLSQPRYVSKIRSQEFDHRGSPITIEDVYGRTTSRCSNAYTDEASPKKQTVHGEFLEEHFLTGDKTENVGENIDAAMDTSIELYRKMKEAEDRATTLSEESRKGNFLQYRGLSEPALLQTVRNLTEEKADMALEVSSVLADRIADMALFREKNKLGRVELDAQIRRLEMEKNELQSTLEKELDRRSSEWSLKLEKLQAEERRLRERVRELAEQNVYLQREVSTSSEREVDARTQISLSEKQLRDLSIQVQEAVEEIQYLQKSLSEMQEKYSAAEEERDCLRRNYDEKVIECKDLHQSISRLQRTCNDQEKTIDGLRGLCDAFGKKNSLEHFDPGSAKLQVEHMRLTGVEHALRKEVESYRAEVDSLRLENIDLLNRLKNDGKESGFSTFKLDRELENRVDCFQNQFLPLLMESSQLGRKLFEFVKTNGRFALNNGEASTSCLDGQVLIECEVKLQGLERAAENITNSMRTISSVLQEKPALCHENYCSVNESPRQNERKSEDVIKSALKAETLLTSLLRDKLYSKELDLEQLQAELAAAVRGNDILKCELQNAVDNCSCINHKMKELELQMMRKDDTVNKLQSDLQECKKELAIVRGILPKVTEERDVMWEEVRQYSEKNMLLNSEINVLRKKIDDLDEDILLKEGQITILKDSIGKPFDLLAGPDSTDDLCWMEKRH